jgi:predicted secreted protein
VGLSEQRTWRYYQRHVVCLPGQSAPKEFQMQIGSFLAVFFVIWWLSFVAVLPIGNQSQSEAGGEIVAGTDPGAPVSPRLWRKVGMATALAVLFTGLLLWGLSNETLHHYWNR